MAEGTVDPGAAATDLDFTALKAGHKIGRYTIAAVLGQGGFGITYRARDEQLHREVAIKEYLPSALAVRQDGVTVLPRSTKVAEDFGWGRQRFVDEGRTLATLQRAPAIVNVFDFLEANGTAYIVMEMLEGETLEHRLQRGPLTPTELDRILWPLLDGLEKVHATGFLHRDIKPANILLDARGHPTLIDFGASRAAIAGRTSAMTAIFTPGYAAAEQMTSARQGPWTDIYGLSATLYHAITGAAPPSAFDRMLDDHYVPLVERTFAGIAPGLLAGVDAGLAVRASDRPQSIAAWRPLLAGMSAPVAVAPVAVTPAAVVPVSVPPAPKRGKRLWLGVAAALVLALAGGGAWVATRPAPVEVAASPPVEPPSPAAPSAAPSAEDQQRQQELERLRAEKAERDRQAHDAQLRQQALEEERQKLQAEQAEKDKADRDAKAQAARAELEKRKALEADKAHAAEAEAALHLAPLDRQHIQVALTALGFDTNGTDGVFGQHTHDMIASWQKGRAYPATGYVSAAQVQELLQAASAAVAKFDDDQKKAAAAPAPAPSPVPPPVPQAATPAPAPLPATPHWTGMFKCDVSDGGMRLDFPVVNGAGSEKRSNARGNQVVAVQVSGGQFSGRFDWTPGNSSPTSTTFSGAISGATIHKDIYVQTSGRRGTAECHLDLQNVANP